MTSVRRTGSVAAALAVAATLFSGVANAKTFHVSPTGDDAHQATEAEPLRTVQKAANRARAGDTIVLHAGIYAQTVVLRHSGEEGKPITLTSRKGKRAVIQPVEKGQRPPAQAVLLQAEAGYQHAIGWINVEGLEIRHGYDGVKMYNAHDVVVRAGMNDQRPVGCGNLASPRPPIAKSAPGPAPTVAGADGVIGKEFEDVGIKPTLKTTGRVTASASAA
jgi:hypothetical protein